MASKVESLINKPLVVKEYLLENKIMSSKRFKMTDRQMLVNYWVRFFLITGIMLVLPLGCSTPAKSKQKAFASGEEAVQGFIQAMKTNNTKELLAILGSRADELIYSGDEVADENRKEMFLKLYDEQHKLQTEDDKLILTIGSDDWPFPIPLIHEEQQWVFDTAAGKEEILNRRIGRNELNTIQVLLAIVDAQREYAMNDHNGDGLLEYAQKFKSDPQQKNGLYWQSQAGETPSPLGDLVAQATQEGYFEKEAGEGPQPFHGYFYRILTAQGAKAPGGAFDYIVNGKMIGGFAVAAYPAEYGNSGIMTFLVNHEGVIYEKDLGKGTEKKGAKIKVFDPDPSWTIVPPK